MPKKDLNIKNLPDAANDKDITAADFKFVDFSKRTHEEKFQTRPTTFFKDSLKRFAKNKSSVVAAFILGLLLVLSFAIPIIDRNDIKGPHPEMTYLEPKLFDAGTGFWDGTKTWDKIPTYIPTLNDGSLDMNKNHWQPNPERFNESAVSNKTFSIKLSSNGIVEVGEMSDFKFSVKALETGKVIITVTENTTGKKQNITLETAL